MNYKKIEKGLFFFIERKKVSLHISVLIGEVIHGLRTILDYLAYEFALSSSKPFNERDIMFPIVLEKENFDKLYNNKKLKGIPSKYIDFIESLQPYKTDIPKNSVLKILHDLDIIDKHRLLIVVSHGINMGDIIHTKGNSTAPIELIVDEKNVFFNKVENNIEEHWLNYNTIEGNNQWYIENNFQIEFIFENIGTHERKNVVEVLLTIRNYIYEVLKKSIEIK